MRVLLSLQPCKLHCPLHTSQMTIPENRPALSALHKKKPFPALHSNTTGVNTLTPNVGADCFERLNADMIRTSHEEGSSAIHAKQARTFVSILKKQTIVIVQTSTESSKDLLLKVLLIRWPDSEATNSCKNPLGVHLPCRQLVWVGSGQKFHGAHKSTEPPANFVHARTARALMREHKLLAGLLKEHLVEVYWGLWNPYMCMMGNISAASGS